MQPKQKQVSINALSRRLANGNEYNVLFPQPKNEKIKLKQGDTYTSIDLIIQWVLKHNHEVSKVATKLQKRSLEATYKSIHHFLYNHFQYKADGEAQLLRSPAYAWETRFEGIDCKSYSIIASAILVQLGIKHYIRKIKQAGFSPDNFTHVYVIVPKNQKTGSLNNGYYTIDGTLPTTTEPNYTDKKDFYMDKLQHYGLQGLRSSGQPPPPPPKGTKGTEGEKQKIDWVKFGESLKIGSKLNQLFKTPIDCWGRSGFSGGRAEVNIRDIDNYFSIIFTNINIAVQNNDVATLSELDNQVRGNLNAGLCGYIQKRGEKNWNSCTTESIDKSIRALQYYKVVVEEAYEGWIKQYYSTTSNGANTYTNTGIEGPPTNFYYAYTGRPCQIVTPIRVFTRKSNIPNIVAFKPTNYIEDVVKNNTPFDVSKYLNQLQQVSEVIVKFTGNSSGNGNTNNPADIYDIQNPKNTKNAGMGLLIGGLAFAGLAVWGFNKFKNKK